MSIRQLLTPNRSKLLLLGNEAIVRGALEANLGFFAAYPGTPSSEILDAMLEVSEAAGIYAEVSVNEKVAFESCLGASWSGIRAMTSMKHVGLNVAADALMSSASMRTIGSFVAVVADDPSMWSSQNEQDTRLFARLANVPALEPSSPQEALELTRKAFELSEKHGTIVILRTTTRLSHMRGEVVTGDLPEEIAVGKRKKGEFKKDPQKFVNLPQNSRRLKLEHAKIMEAFEKEEGRGLVEIEGKESSRLGIIAGGVSYGYVKEAMNILGTKEAKIMKVMMPYPLPREPVAEFLSSLDEVLVVEELEPVIEDQVKLTAFEKGIGVKVHGKDLVPRDFELTPEKVARSLSAFLKVDLPLNLEDLEKRGKEASSLAPPVPPTLCPACPHRNTFYAIRKAATPRSIFPSDIGCYTLGYFPPLKTVDTTVDMGASISIAHGISIAGKGEGRYVVATIGDSTFFHTGLPALANAVSNGSDFILVILDNGTTAMTGHQPNPGSPEGMRGKRISIEEVAKSMGADYVEVVDPYDIKALENALKNALSMRGVRVIVARRDCALKVVSEKRRKGESWDIYRVDESKCTGCKVCINAYGCPAIRWDREKKKAYIDEEMCWGCGGCAQVCPYDAIEVKK
ncbi:MAG: indolepyruvate ferredoxin oxidoreductase subunit alpha [Fervidicoccaceae archaeon]